MVGLLYHVLSSSSLVSLGMYHLICSTRNYLKSPRDYSARPFHPIPQPQRLRLLQLYILILCLLIAFVHQILVSSDADPLLKGRTPVHRFTSLQSAAVLFLFLVLSLAIYLSETTHLLPLPPDLFFALASAIFFLQYSVSSASSSVQTSDLQAECDSVSARISALSSILCLALACRPRFFIADASLATSLCLQGLWVLQTGLSLRVDAFIPEGCHKLLDVVSGVEGSTKCDLEDSKLRAVAILDLIFLVHVLFVVIIALVTYAAVAKTIGVTCRGFGPYEALPNAADSNHNHNHIQMKALSGTQA